MPGTQSLSTSAARRVVRKVAALTASVCLLAGPTGCGEGDAAPDEPAASASGTSAGDAASGAATASNAGGVGSTAEGDAQLVSLGARYFDRKGCIACHETDPAVAWSQSTHMAGFFGSTVELSDGRTIVADADYITESMTDPNKVKPAGVVDEMPPQPLSDEEIVAITAFIESLKDLAPPAPAG